MKQLFWYIFRICKKKLTFSFVSDANCNIDYNSDCNLDQIEQISKRAWHFFQKICTATLMPCTCLFRTAKDCTNSVYRDMRADSILLHDPLKQLQSTAGELLERISQDLSRISILLNNNLAAPISFSRNPGRKRACFLEELWTKQTHFFTNGSNTWIFEYIYPVHP